MISDTAAPPTPVQAAQAMMPKAVRYPHHSKRLPGPETSNIKAANKNDAKFGELKWIVEQNGAIRGWNEKNAIEISLTPTMQFIVHAGAGRDLRWPRAVRPGDVLRIEVEVIEVRSSHSRPTHGLVKTRAVTLNQKDEPVQVQVTSVFVPRRAR